MHNIMAFICEELEELDRKVAKEGKLTKTELGDVKDLAEAKKNILKCEMLSEGSEYSMAMGGGYSRRGSYAMGGGSYRGGSYADGESYRAADGVRNYVRPDGSYADSSYARGRGAGAKRDAMGRYSSEGGLDEQTKEELRKLIEKM